MSMLEEKRKNRRYPLPAVVSIKAHPRYAVRHITALVNDISYSGMGVTSYAPLPAGTRISVVIPRIMGKEIGDTISGSVVRFSRRKGFYNLGIMFDATLHPDKQPHLYDTFFSILTHN